MTLKILTLAIFLLAGTTEIFSSQALAFENSYRIEHNPQIPFETPPTEVASKSSGWEPISQFPYPVLGSRWIRISTSSCSSANKNSHPETQAWLDLGYTQNHFSEMFSANGATLIARTGLAVPWKSRPTPTWTPAFPLPNTCDEQRLIRIRHFGEPLAAVLSLQKPDAAIKKQVELEHTVTAFTAVVIAMLLFNIVIYLRTRVKAHLAYILTIPFLHGLGSLEVSGMTQQLLWHSAPWISLRANSAFNTIGVSLAILFMQRMLAIPGKNGQFLEWSGRIGFALGFSFFIMPLPLFEPFRTVVPVVLSIYVVIFLFHTASLARKKNRAAAIIFAAWLVFALGGLGFMVWVLGFPMPSFWVQYGIPIGGTIDLILVAAALAEQYQETQRARNNLSNILIQTEHEHRMEITKLAAEVAHEINNPLAAIELAATLGNQQINTEKHHEAGNSFNKIRESVVRIRTIASKLAFTQEHPSHIPATSQIPITKAKWIADHCGASVRAIPNNPHAFELIFPENKE
jgi:hypothetical protein